MKTPILRMTFALGGCEEGTKVMHTSSAEGCGEVDYQSLFGQDRSEI